MGWSSASQPESYARTFQEDVGSVGAGRSADGQMSAVPVEHLGDWELLRECDHEEGTCFSGSSRSDRGETTGF